MSSLKLLLLFTFLLYIGFSGCATTPSKRMFVSQDDYISGESDLKITVIDVGQGDSIFIQTPNGKRILVDGGGIPSWKGSGDTARQYVIPFLKKQFPDDTSLYLDAVVMSHPHADHVGGLITILKNIPVKVVYDSGYEHGDAEYLECLETIKEKNIPYQVVADGDSINIDPDLDIKIYSPPQNFQFEGANNNSIVIKLTYKEFSILLTGDIEAEAETYLASKYGNKLASNVLKSPHHGSRSSSTAEFLRVVKPEVAIISCGENNQFGHPHPEVLSRYKNRNIQVFRTDYDGDITVITNGFTFTIETSKN